jgi:hypothetical protein
MPFEQRIPHPLRANGVQCYAPIASGVYGISNARGWIYIDQTGNIQGALLEHLRDVNSTVLKWEPTGFVFETCQGEQSRIRQDCLVLDTHPSATAGRRGVTSPLYERGSILNNKIPPSRFILKGFAQDQGLRRFTFEAIEADHVRTQFTVHADLALIRNYGIHIQELPLLCRELLERHADTKAIRGLTFTEEDMRLFSADRLIAKQAAAQKRKPPRRPPPNTAGTASPLSMQTRA